VAWTVLIHPEAQAELDRLPAREKVAVVAVMDKLRAIGPALPHPHSSNVQTASDLRELRPRQGRSPWRAFYRKIGESFLVAAIGPEAQSDRRGFQRSINEAEKRLDELEDDE
jgi:hypothetical protein